ncbi:MAG TPA: peptide chain release factor N(5)-glutamine methyltransferase [Solirubrobacterales bacterium]|nr:peptide chain release factor N(5)-glutamine methyltransferase [Solirubrobacterales bacterium]
MESRASATVGEALPAAIDALHAAGVENARLDAELLLCEATGWDRARIAGDPELRLPVGSSRRFSEMTRRRVRREPVAYILGRRAFRRIELLVDRRVLIPRPETEFLVEAAVELSPRSVLDVGTGSGAIALAIADELPGARVLGIDTSAGALRVAQANADRLGFGDHVDLVLRGISTLGEAMTDPLDLLVANLPYVREEDWPELQPEIRDYEPREALVAGPSGLEAIESLLGVLGRIEGRPAAIALEVGFGQADQVATLVRAAGYQRADVRADLAGIDRVVVGR